MLPFLILEKSLPLSFIPSDTANLLLAHSSPEGKSWRDGRGATEDKEGHDGIM